jgi:uncharacterized Ntn-hydrolase superfamily protein|tara:strand:- start:593 stop:928 length:336 start_codon:yes stop_codon:yes gene_type:complete
VQKPKFPGGAAKTKRLPQEVINKWPDVFGDVDVHAIPLEYLHSLRVRFNNGKVWDIAVDVKKNPVKSLEKTLKDLFNTYDSSIKHVDFKVDTDRIKKDVQKRTTKFIKHRK